MRPGRAGRLLLGVCLVAAIGHGAGLVASAQRAPGTIAVAAASDLQTVLPELVRSFERATGSAVTTSIGSSGTFFAQISNGAPFDVFMSADVDYPRRLATGKHADAGTLYVYATGRIVLWTRKESGLDVQRGLPLLTDARVRRIAIANPQFAPYGRAAVAALKKLDLYDRIQSKLVTAENIAQAAQFAESGNADVGILSLSFALAPALAAKGVYSRIPVEAYPPIEQAAIVVSRSNNKALAERFVSYLRQPEARTLLARYGIEPPAPR